MKIISFLILGSVLILIGCSDQKVNEPNNLNGQKLQSLVMKSTNGDKIANDSLSTLIDIELAGNNLYNFIQVDSFNIDGFKYFFVLIEYPNPSYNRFAIYDSSANCYLIDKSLSGEISFSAIDIQDIKFIKILEKFIVKADLYLAKLSLYRKINDSFKLVYRSFSELQTPKNIFYHTIYSFSGDTIKTRILVPKKYKLKEKEDEFLFDNTIESFHSNKSLFDTLVYKEIADYDYEAQK